ncbi:uncharacterized protein KIAA0232 homolog [Tachyglossus aculeatus]|uniref:uncharacterized protein KIAA0232 homolog n=1 Tax=Tachyglossus aculeatus TaxID=9261 RepID=UPI0018F39061|nr:uncharacterized protein KIAA0232 homolog [Tachyglossus aculeatus]
MRPPGPAAGDGGLPSASALGSPPGPASLSAMSLLHALGPVQTWLGQELEKCGIDAMIYTRYVLSLLLHDSYDYDLQEQENDIFLGWEKGAYKKWGKSKKKCSDLTLEEMKKQAAVQCLRSASDESSGIETLVEELCSRLKDLQSKQEEKIHKKLEGSPSPEAELSPTAKDQVEMYYEAFPPLSEKPVCLQEIMPVWNKSKVCSYSSSSSSSTALPPSTDTSSPKDCNSETEVIKERSPEAPSAVHERIQPKKSQSEKENKFGAGPPEEKPAFYKKQGRHKAEGKARPRSWSSGSSEAGSSSSGNQGEPKGPAKGVRARHKTREVRGKRGRNGQGRLSVKTGERGQRKVPAGGGGGGGGAGGGSFQQLGKRGKRPSKESGRKDPGGAEGREPPGGSRDDREYKEEPLWYTEPIAEYFVPLSRKSKLETSYRNRQEAAPGGFAEGFAEGYAEEAAPGLGPGVPPAYLAAGTFVDGHFVEVPAVPEEAGGAPWSPPRPPPGDRPYLDDVHLAELTHFYEVDIDQSMLDPGASDATRGESRILSMIRRKSQEDADFEAECCIVLDGLELQGESAIWTDSTSSAGAEGFFLQDLSGLAQFWECRSSPSSGDADGESFGGESPFRVSPGFDGAALGSPGPAGRPELFPAPREGAGIDSCFSVFEVQCSNSVLPFSFETLALGDEEPDAGGGGALGKTQSRLLIWTKNSAFDEHEHCSNLSTRTCSPWSHSEETRSDTEAWAVQPEDAPPPPPPAEELGYGGPAGYADEELLEFLREDARRPPGDGPAPGFPPRSKLESVCGIPLEHRAGDGDYGPAAGGAGPRGRVEDLWPDGGPAAEAEGRPGEPFPDGDGYAEAPREPGKAVRRSEYRLWDGQKEDPERRPFGPGRPAEAGGGGDYTTPARPWEGRRAPEHAFILGGVYGELKAGPGGWAVLPPAPPQPRASLLQCAASDVVTIAGTDVFTSPGHGLAPGPRQRWRPLAALEQGGPARGRDGGPPKGFSLIFREDLLGACGAFQGDEPGLEYAFSSLELNHPFSQVLHVECSFEPEGPAALSPPGLKPKPVPGPDPDGQVFRPRICGADRTRYRAIRISPRTHFRPISAAELSPGGGSGSGSESDGGDDDDGGGGGGGPPGPPGPPAPPAPADAFEGPPADLRPLEEDAEKEGHYYGKNELESGRFLPRLKKAGMEKSAQTSLDSQEGSPGALPPGRRDRCSECRPGGAGEAEDRGGPGADGRILAPCQEEEPGGPCGCKAGCQFPALEDRPASPGELGEFPLLSTDLQGGSSGQEKQCWWEKALYSPLFPGTQCEGCYPDAKGENGVGEYPDGKEMADHGDHLVDFNRVSSVYEARCAGEKDPGGKSNGFRKKIYSSDSSNSEDTASEGASDWVDPCEEALFSRTHL